MNIAYILNTYPQPSHSFIRREITALEAEGHQIRRLAMRRSEMALVDPADQKEAEKTSYVLDAGAAGLLKSTFKALRKSPERWLKTLRLAIACGRRSDVGVLRHMIYFTEGCHILGFLSDNGATEHLHAHFGTNAATVAMLTKTLGGPPYSFTVHGPEEFDNPRGLSLNAKIHHSAFTVAISQFGRSQLCRWADFADWPRLKVVHCGIEPARFADPAPVPDGPRRLISIGRFVEQKGQLALIMAIAKLHQTHPEVHLTLIGDGPMRQQIERLIKEHGLTECVTLTGWLDEAAIAEELARSHGLVMPSFAEGLPMVVMEAMAAARPVIATYIAGTPELVLEGETGWLVPAGDTDALVKAMRALVETKTADLQEMGRHGRERVLQRHDVGAEARKLASFMQKP